MLVRRFERPSPQLILQVAGLFAAGVVLVSMQQAGKPFMAVAVGLGIPIRTLRRPPESTAEKRMPLCV